MGVATAREGVVSIKVSVALIAGVGPVWTGVWGTWGGKWGAQRAWGGVQEGSHFPCTSPPWETQFSGVC